MNPNYSQLSIQLNVDNEQIASKIFAIRVGTIRSREKDEEKDIKGSIT